MDELPSTTKPQDVFQCVKLPINNKHAAGNCLHAFLITDGSKNTENRFADFTFSQDGMQFLLAKTFPAEKQQSVQFERWLVGSSAQGPQLLDRTISTIEECNQLPLETGKNTPDWFPSKKLQHKSKSIAFISDGKYLRLGSKLVTNQISNAQGNSELPEFFNEFWEEADQRGNYLVLSRRKRPQQSSASQEKERIELIKNRIYQRERKERARGIRRTRGLPRRRRQEDFMDFDDAKSIASLSADSDDSEDSDSLNDFDSQTSSKLSANSLRSFDSVSWASDDSVSERSEMSLSDNDDESENFDIDGSSETSTLSTSASLHNSTDSTMRARICDYLSGSKDPAYFGELVKQHSQKICDACEQLVPRWLHCFVCQDADLDICLPCVDNGQWCLEKSHQMMEADSRGPVAMRRFSNWLFEQEIRVYDTASDKCISEFSFEGKTTLRNSPPALHPTASLLAWPLSSDKLLIASFEGDKQRIIHKMKLLNRNSSKVSISLKFSGCGKLLFTGTIEAERVEVDYKGQGMLLEQFPVTYRLYMHVAMLRLHFDNGRLEHPQLVCEKSHTLERPVAALTEDLPFDWIWTTSEVYLAVAGEKVELFKVRLPTHESSSSSLDSIYTMSSGVPLPCQYKASTIKGHVGSEYDGSIILAVGPAPDSQPISPFIVHMKASDLGEWVSTERSFTKPESLESKPRISNKSKVCNPVALSPQRSSITDLQESRELDPFRSDIRLLHLLPGQPNDEIRCRLTKVSLDSLEDVKERWSTRVSEIKHASDERSQSQKSDQERDHDQREKRLGINDPNFIPKTLGFVDYSDAENANVTLLDLMGKTVPHSQSASQPGGFSIAFTNTDQLTSAICAAAMHDLNDTNKSVRVSVHPDYDYAALSYVWGSWSEERTIILDSKRDIPVSNNLFAALRRLRSPTTRRTLWVDSMCINQKDAQERSSQVQLMGRIYSSASSVIVWLGDANVPKSSMIEDPKIVGTELIKSEDGNGEKKDPHPHLTEWRIQTLKSAISTASPPWWTRAWVTQELVLAQDVQVAFGEVEVNWKTFTSKLSKGWWNIAGLHRLVALRENRHYWQYKGSIGETALMARNCAATDPRDKVYSLLGLVKPSEAMLVKPDYTRSLVEVFAQATYADLRANIDDNSNVYQEALVSGPSNYTPELPGYPVSTIHWTSAAQTGMRPDRFRILNWAKPTPNRLNGLPTWAVDFSDPDCFTEDAHFRYGRERWTFDGNRNLRSRARMSVSVDGRRLTVRGLLFDQIHNVILGAPARKFKQHTDLVLPELQSALAALPAGKNPFTSITGGSAQLRTDSSRTRTRPNWVVKETKPGSIVIGYENVTTSILPNWDPESRPQVDWSNLLSLEPGAGCEVEGCRCTAAKFFQKWDESVGLSNDARNFLHYDRELTSPWDNYCSVLKQARHNAEIYKWDKEEHEEDPLREEDEDIGWLFMTTHGFLGIAKESVKPGDVIALLYGSDIPVVLRQVDDHYVFEGRAWVNGIMMGELWNIYQDPMLEEMDFEIW